MQSQRTVQLPHLVSQHEEASDVLMTSPFGNVHDTFDKACAGGSLLSNILHGDNCDDWTDMECDDEMDTPDHLLQHHQRLVRGEDGMKSRDSTGSMDSASSTSSTQEYEPELSQSFGSAISYDLRTPIKPSTNLPSHSMQHTAYPKAEQGFRTTAPGPAPTSLSTSPRSISPARTSFGAASNEGKSIAQKRHNLGELLGMKSSEARSASASETKSKRPAAPGLAGRLKINLPPSASSNFDVSNMPITPGGHFASGARDGAATGGAPVSPFEPPTPLYAPNDGAFARAAAAAVSPVTPPSSALRPKILQRHTSTPLRHNSSNMLGMSPITSQFAAVSMRKASSSKGSTSNEDGSAMCASPTMLLTPPYSPFGTSKALPNELEIPTTPLERKTSASSTGSSSSSSSGIKKIQSRGSDVVRSAVSPSSRQKAVKAKVSPYTLSREDSPAKTNNTPSDSSATPKMASLNDASPSLLRDVVKPPMAAPMMDRCTSEPIPKTVSARHLAHRTLHPVFSASYTLGDELGSGGFGFVVSATRDRDGMPVAVKFIFKDKVPTHGWVRDDVFGAIPMEAFVLKVVDSPFVVKFVDLFDDDQFFYLVMEHHGTPWKAPSGDAKKASSKASSASPSKAIDDKAEKIAMPASTPLKVTQPQSHAAPVPSPTVAVFPPESDVAMESTPPMISPGSTSYTSSANSSSDGLVAPPPRPAPMQRQSSCDLFECIEQHSRLSEDKARWVFAQIVEAVYYLDRRGICHRDIKDENCVIDSDFNVKLIDFGSAVITDPRRPTPYFNRFFGTMTFASSEILQGKQYRAPHAEVWSLGVLLSILLSGECPFADPTAAIRGKISRPNGSWSSDALNLLMACLVVNPDKRATIAQIRQHPWVVKAWKQRGQTRPGDDDISPYSTSA